MSFLRHKSESGFELKVKVKKKTIEIGLLSFKAVRKKAKLIIFFLQYS